MSDYELVETSERLAQAADALSKGERVAVDLESNGFFRYRERVCLVQLASPNAAYLVDTLAIDDVGPLGELMADAGVEKIFHAPDYDIRSLDRDWSFRVRNLFDTSTAAALAGSTRLGLQAVLEEYVGVRLPKARKLQRSDWTLRPLSEEAMRYAANDVLHLARLRNALAGRLGELGRLAWAREESVRMEELRHTEPEQESAFLSMKGSGKLDGRGLAILRSLWQYRDDRAYEQDRPHFKVMSDAALVQVSANPRLKLRDVKGLGRYGRGPGARGLRDAIREGMEAEPVSVPKKSALRERLGGTERRKVGGRMARLKGWRKALGAELALAPSLLWPTASLTRLARYPDSLGAELDGADVRAWQAKEFAPSLRDALAEMG